MLAIVYLIVMTIFGDTICRRFCRFVSLPHRLAAAFLVGLVTSTWITYLAARIFAQTSRPLLFGNAAFFLLALATIYLLHRKFPDSKTEQGTPLSSNRWDWIFIGIFFVVTWWMMFSSFNMQGGKLQISNHQWSDFGPNVALMQSFALGRNFPTEYPHFAGDRIRYHFLFYFQAGNLEYLGLNPAWSNNLLSILSIVSMLALVMTLGYLLFKSRVVGRIGAALFFFHGSLAYIPFIRSKASLTDAYKAATQLNAFLPSGFPYRGEDWGMWSLVNFLNQRHFASAIGILLVVVAFLIERYSEQRTSARAATGPVTTKEQEVTRGSWLKQWLKDSWSFIFFGALVGMLPMWNGAVFIAAMTLLGTFVILFPLRLKTLSAIATAGVVALPQVVYLKTGNVREASYSLFHWGYTIDNPTVFNVAKYLGFSFGFKWIFIVLAIVLLGWFQKRFAIAVASLLAVAFLFQFSEEVLANHKFLNMWLILANLFVAYGLFRLWRGTVRGTSAPGKLAAVVLLVLVTLGGLIDFVPIHRAYWAEVPLDGDPLVRWTREHTDPRAVFLSDRFVTHPILLAGRSVFFGWPYYTWGAGYRTNDREIVYRQLFEERSPSQLLQLLNQNHISYVAIDDGLRRGNFIKNLNEAVYESHFEKVFHDDDNRYGGLSIFKVPNSEAQLSEQTTVSDSAIDPNIPPVNAFEGGRGTARGQFASARGVALDHEGHIYVADTGNSRIQKFSSTGDFIASIGRGGSGVGRLKEPVGVAVDTSGNIYVTDAGTHALVKFGNDGAFISQWPGPAPGFYGPRDVAVGPQGYLYVVDQGWTRIVVMDTNGNAITQWGKKGQGEGEFDDPTGVAVGGNRVYVADLRNARIQAFDLGGKFIREWPVPEWRQPIFHNPDVSFDPERGRLYASSGATNEVLVFDADGKRLGPKTPDKPSKLDRPSGLALSDAEAGRRLCIMNTDGARLSWINVGSR